MLLTNQQILEKYGKPGDSANFTILNLPYPFYFDWDTTKSTSKVLCHKLIKDDLEACLKDELKEYGQEKIHELKIDEFSGCFNHRPKRGFETQYMALIEQNKLSEAINYLSTHSWAIALDRDADRNKLRENHTTARFARAEYKKMIDIWYAHGFRSYGREKDFDWMHMEYYGLQLISNA